MNTKSTKKVSTSSLKKNTDGKAKFKLKSKSELKKIMGGKTTCYQKCSVP